MSEIDGDLLNLDVSDADDGRKWIVLYPEDYDNVMIDGDDNVALLVDAPQAAEVLRLANITLADLSAKDAPDEDPIELLIERLEGLREDDE